MAEFKYVMHHFIRARKIIGKGEAPLIRCNAYEMSDEEVEKLEKEVLEFVEKNPEPDTPTWWEWLVRNGIIKVDGREAKLEDTLLPAVLNLDKPIPEDFYNKHNMGE